jgi:hypothetical protein
MCFRLLLVAGCRQSVFLHDLMRSRPCALTYMLSDVRLPRDMFFTCVPKTRTRAARDFERNFDVTPSYVLETLANCAIDCECDNHQRRKGRAECPSCKFAHRMQLRFGLFVVTLGIWPRQLATRQ